MSFSEIFCCLLISHAKKRLARDVAGLALRKSLRSVAHGAYPGAAGGRTEMKKAAIPEDCGPFLLVPKGRLELPWPCDH